MRRRHQQSERSGDPTLAVFSAAMPHLSEHERNSIRNLPVVHRFVGRSHLLAREGTQVTRFQVLCKGWAIRYRWLDDERRQILDFVLPGELIGLHVDGKGISICDVMAITACEVGEIEVTCLDQEASRNPGIATGLRQCLQNQIAQASDQVMRLGRMTAYERVCGLLVDIHARQRPTATVGRTVDFPVTQAVVADLLGLSVVHVNRQIMRLRREGLVSLTRRQLTILDEQRLAEVGGYRDRDFAGHSPMVVAAE